jgi:hypothetical protein
VGFLLIEGDFVDCAFDVIGYPYYAGSDRTVLLIVTWIFTLNAGTSEFNLITSIYSPS